MINSEIKKIKYNYNKIKALYFGDILIWEAQEGMFDYNFSGIFNNEVTNTNNILNVTYEDGSTEEVHIPYDNTIKEFDFDFEKPIKIISLPNKNIYKNITNFPKQSELNSCEKYFYECSADKLDLSNFNTSNVTSMLEMFRGCSGLTSLDLSNFDTSNVTFMSYMFYNCSGLTSLDLSNFDTSNVTLMGSMFDGCSGLTSLNLSSFNTSKVTNMSSMFRVCGALTSLDLSSFNTSKVIDMSGMFFGGWEGSNKLNEINFGNFDTSNVLYMNMTFTNCSTLTTVTGAFEGTKVNLDLRDSPLTNESAMVFINGLSKVDSTQKITFKSSTYDTLTAEQIAIATSKGWTVVRA